MTISDVSHKYQVPEDTLRYYERIGLIPPVRRTKGGIRDYDEEDCRWVEFVRCMRGAGLSIEVLVEYLRLMQEGDSTVEARRTLLVEQRELLLARMEELRSTLERLNYKIENYERVGSGVKKKGKGAK